MRVQPIQNLRVSNRSLYQTKALKSLSKRFKSLSGLATHDRGRKRLREAVMWLKSNSVTDHRRVYNKNLSVCEVRCSDRGSTPLRSTAGRMNPKLRRTLYRRAKAFTRYVKLISNLKFQIHSLICQRLGLEWF